MVSLASSKLFAQLPAEQVKRLTAASRELQFGPGEVIFKEGDPGDGLYVVLSGCAQISATIAGGERHVFSTVGPGDVFGEMAVLDNLPRSAHASAEGEATLAFVPREQFLDLLKSSPALSLTLVQEISRRLRDFNVQYIRKVLQVERMAIVGRFASTIVHDLKNPLAIIRVGVALASAEKATPDDRQAARKRVEVQIDRITSMVNDILDFTRGTPQQVVMARLEFNMFVERVVSEFEPELSTKGIKIEFENPSPTMKLSLNPHRLSRAVYNIVFNAVDVMPEGGTIRMRFNETERAVIMEIEDSGPGIAAEIAENLFEPFATFGKSKGTGLGLFIARRIVEEHRGTISARNAPRGGAVFSITLPKT